MKLDEIIYMFIEFEHGHIMIDAKYLTTGAAMPARRDSI